jgi:diguanylate cyclase (GGDEF)-like protein
MPAPSPPRSLLPDQRSVERRGSVSARAEEGSGVRRLVPAPSVRAAAAFVAAVIAAGGSVLVAVTAVWGSELLHQPAWIWLVAAGVLAGELFPIQVRRRGADGEITPSTTFGFALVVAAGPVAILLQAAASVSADLIARKDATKIAFNAAQYALSLGAAALVLGAFTDVPRAGEHPFASADLAWIVVAGAVFFVINSGLVATVLALLDRTEVWRYFAQDFVFQAAAGGVLLGVSPIVVVAGDFSVFLLPLLVLPLVTVIQGQRQGIVNEHQALHDALTGLPNRVLFADRVEQALRVAERDGGRVAVMIMDLDHFKEVNDTLGHHHGDLLLMEVARRLQTSVRTQDSIARLGGDEFAVLLPTLRGVETSAEVAGRIVTALCEPMQVGDTSLEIAASIGGAIFPEHGDDVDVLLQHADIAMYSAKRSGAGFDLYEAQKNTSTPRRLVLAAELRLGLELDALGPHFQPKVSLETGEVVGMEALMRWKNPERGAISPSEFIPIAEQTGLITAATMMMIDRSLAARQAWLHAGHALRVAVNLSPRSLLDARLPERIAELLDEHTVPASALEIEITETVIMADPDRAEAVLNRLDAMGIRMAIDDFGTGYSSLALLRRLPVSAIKIDRSFVTNMARDASDTAIVRSTIDLARNLSLEVIAEGVETAAVNRQLAELRCDVAQGFFFSAPLPPAQVLPWLRDAPGLVTDTAPAAAPVAL